MAERVRQIEPETDGIERPEKVSVLSHALTGSLRIADYLIATCVLSTILVFLIEIIARGSFVDTILFFEQTNRPAWTTVGIYACIVIGLDAVLGRSHHGLLLIAPLALLFAWIGRQKALYLGDPIYPSDFLYSRQLVDLFPLLARERPWTAMGIVVAAVIALVLLVFLWHLLRRRALPLNLKARLWRLGITIPLLAVFVSAMDHSTFSWTRDRLRVLPIMWDQKENYAYNGFTMAFALNVPMANVTAPEGYSAQAIEAIAAPSSTAFTASEKPDIIMVMSESFWDPTRLPGVDFNRDPIPAVRANQTGAIFSPEFGGMTANVEFEALTGFSNAFLPYGSIPYQQYVRQPLPSLATFLKSAGYVTKAIHPFRQWFWNRRNVYEAFGFDTFMSEGNLPKLAERGPLVSDQALTEEIIRQADEMQQPLFFFAVTLQGHGPYEPHRYKDPSIDVTTQAGEAARATIRTFAEGVSDADSSLRYLMNWANKRERPTILVFFGDHLPPLGQAYVATGYMRERIADRRAPFSDMLKQHETPLVIWSNRTGTVFGVGTVSPVFLPLHVLELAGIGHPYYTGFLGSVRDHYKVIDRHILWSSDDEAKENWAGNPHINPWIANFRLLQYDMMFGAQHGTNRFFPEMNAHQPAM
ncbi:LTA synthase family protein [Phyllobacterium zundukense]|uniref:Cation tolerance protein CutA n=1 Tax=Phyllobacterium zundukense TaxID=1867719 RepID=A0A2N9VPY1_9HYPH|nr:cation tolerance protein CutA [Phyllobacterium zundukense]PIO41549.1 cation tolerance protein CutA [Phyllobacterium zundukense]